VTSAGTGVGEMLTPAFNLRQTGHVHVQCHVMPPTTTCYSNEIRGKKNKRVYNIGIIVTQIEQVSDLMIQHCVYCHVMSSGGGSRRRTPPSPVVGRSWLHRIYCVLCVGSQLTSHTSSTATPTHLSLSSLVMVWRRAETPRDGSRHHVWLDSLVGPCAIRGAIR